MEQIFGQMYGGRVLGGLLLPCDVIVGGWRSRDVALELLAEGLTTHLVIPDGGTAPAALAAGLGTDEKVVRPAQIAARVQGAHPDQARSDETWLRRVLSAEGMRPTRGDVHWVVPETGGAEAWIPVRAIDRRPYARRRPCVV